MIFGYRIRMFCKELAVACNLAGALYHRFRRFIDQHCIFVDLYIYRTYKSNKSIAYIFFRKSPPLWVEFESWAEYSTGAYSQMTSV